MIQKPFYVADDTEIIFHIGLHKTGTSFLQKEVFPLLKNIHYIYRSDNPFEIKQHQKNLISEEDLSESLLMYNMLHYGALDRYCMIYGLHALFPQAKIILGIREQESWLRSIYSQSVKMGLTYDVYDVWKQRVEPAYLDIGAYVDRVRDLFDEVYIYSFEEFKKDKLPIIEEMCDFMGVSAPAYRDNITNEKWSGLNLSLGLIRNFLFKKSRYCIDKIEKR